MSSSPGVTKTVVEKTISSPVRDRGSPTKRIIDHKNAKVKHTKNANQVSGSYNKMLYTIDPENAFLVHKDFPSDMPSTEIVRRAIDRQSFIEEYVDENGDKVHRYLYSSPSVQKVKRGGRVEEKSRTFVVSPSKRIFAQEFIEDPHIYEITRDANFEQRRDFIKRIEERTKLYAQDYK